MMEEIVKDICGRLHISSFDRDRSKYVVGMDYHWEKMNALLEVESDNVRFIGIWGMGGIGKTTIARYVYDKLKFQYEVCCFLGDVRQVYESSGRRGTNKVKGIMLNEPNKRIFRLNGKSFSSMSNLMLLKLSNVDVSEDQIYLSNNLRFLKWHGFPLKTLPSDFQTEHLFELNLYGSQINYLWKGMKDFPKLKTIKLSYSHNLIETPDFTMIPKLEMLDLKGRTRLCKVHESVGVLKFLIVLNLEGCNNLQSFPSNVSGLKSLKILNLQGCNSLQRFPGDISDLKSLEILTLQGCNSLQSFPSDIRFTTSESDYLWLAYVSREQFEHDRSLTFEVANLSDGYYWNNKFDSTDSVLLSTSTCIHARFEVTSSTWGYRTSKVIKSGIRLVYKGDIECSDSEDDILPATDASILHQHHNCSTLSEPDLILGQIGNTSFRYNKSREIRMSYKLEVSSFRPMGESERKFLTNALKERRKESFLSYRTYARVCSYCP
ncbi:hypothetical protein LWI28_000988 [Acer negundo]|uniref:NB-ARC domain-containing protein n=1 Tax=Acer negundo TaxID=4023 RepID=A0AAD5I8T3_ACENE|nr:hypothetical protein LWI28_000988 [Acer negundo]